jgi:uncharacterized protein
LLAVIIVAGCSGDEEKHTTPSDDLIIDNAAIIAFPPEILKKYRGYNERLLEDFDIDFRVVTTESEEDINSFTNTAFSSFQKESRSRSGKAILLVINTLLDEAKMGVSMALEPVYTDIFVSYIERKGMVPYFRDSRVADGVYMMMELVRDRAFEADHGKEFMEPMETKSLGGGARNDAIIGQVDPRAKQGQDVPVESTDTPKDIFVKYLASLKAHNKNPNLEIFSEATRSFFQNWTVTDINMDNEYRFSSQCHDEKVFFSDDDSRAVILHPIEQRTCCPRYFVKEQGKWRLDIATMAKVIRFNTEMHWHFSLKDRDKYNTPYEFVFDKLDFDSDGFPYPGTKKVKKQTRWGYRCREYSLPGNQPDKIRCLISWLAEDGAAKNELGIQVNDVIMGIGDGEDHIEDPNFFEASWYLKNIAPGKLVTITVAKEGLGSREQLQGSAP